jgi:hypothetical protein
MLRCVMTASVTAVPRYTAPARGELYSGFTVPRLCCLHSCLTHACDSGPDLSGHCTYGNGESTPEDPLPALCIRKYVVVLAPITDFTAVCYVSCSDNVLCVVRRLWMTDCSGGMFGEGDGVCSKAFMQVFDCWCSWRPRNVRSVPALSDHSSSPGHHST